MTTADMPEHGEPSRHRGPAGPRAQAPKRRTFTTAYKQRILSRYDSLTDPVERGALLRREGLYHSHLEYWRPHWPTRARTPGLSRKSRLAAGRR